MAREVLPVVEELRSPQVLAREGVADSGPGGERFFAIFAQMDRIFSGGFVLVLLEGL